MNSVVPRKLDDIDWATWQPDDHATLLFVEDAERVLLIRKKRGLGAGKINGPGGRLEPGETPLQCAIREVQEELCITPLEPSHRGEHQFHFVDGYKLYVHVFLSGAYEGEPTETDEAIPVWHRKDSIPYDEMWEDDRIWLPLMLAGERFKGRYLFDGDRMLGHHIDWF